MLRQELGTRRPPPAAPGGTEAAYARLIDELCNLCAKRPSPSDHERCELSIAGTTFTLIPSRDDKGIDSMAYFAEVGALPKDRKEAVATRLLETNLLMVARDLPSFCLNPDSGDAVLAGCVELQGLRAETVHDFLTRIGAFAGAWRDSQFLSIPPVPPADLGSSRGA